MKNRRQDYTEQCYTELTSYSQSKRLRKRGRLHRESENDLLKKKKMQIIKTEFVFFKRMNLVLSLSN